jgi:nifR3 family TIM-barrel protein
VLRIGSIAVDPPLVLAPMAGVTDSPFRRIVRGIGGCGLVTMEFISSEAMVRGIGVEISKLLFHPTERPISIQIYGSRPEAMAEAARMVVDSGAEICDINMGCPANKIIRGAAGAALMGNLDLARKIIRTVRSCISIPLTVKLRSGLRAPDFRDLELGRICEEEGVDAVTLHPRTAKQQYRGHADWQRISLLKQSLTIPVIGNGDVETPEDAARMLTETGCDGVMIGRAALTNPWIFRQTEAHLAGHSFRQATMAERRDQVRRHFDLLAESFTDKSLLHKLKTFTGRYSRGLVGGRKLRCKLSEINDPAQLRAEVEQFFDLQLQSTDGEPW